MQKSLDSRHSWVRAGALRTPGVALAWSRVPPETPLLSGVLLLGLLWPGAIDAGWRSQLFPRNWVPLDVSLIDGVNRFYDERGTLDYYGNKVEEDHPAYHPYRFLHDFSYAGYHRGERPIPPEDPRAPQPGRLYDVTRPPYSVPEGGGSSTDARPGIQRAIDDAAAAGGGVVLLPAGEYRLRAIDQGWFLRISSSGVVLRGAGSDRTRIKVDPYRGASFPMSEKCVIFVDGGASWVASAAGSRERADVTRDLPFPTRVIPVDSTSDFRPGDPVVLLGRRTPAFLREHDMIGYWRPDNPGYLFRRTVMEVDSKAKTVTLDAPTRYRVKRSDGPELVKVAPGISEVGLEGFSVGILRHPDEWDYQGDIHDARTTGKPRIIDDLWQSTVLRFKGVNDSWVYDVKSYRPSENAGKPPLNRKTGKRYGNYDVEILNEAIEIDQSRCLTLKDIHFRRAQVDEGSANGYAVRLAGSDVLLENVTMELVKKGYALMDPWSNGNVIKDCVTRNAFDAHDLFHWELSMANLVENHLLEGSWWSAVVQSLTGSQQGHSSTETVFWNIQGTRAPDTGISAVYDRDNDQNGVLDYQEKHGELPDVGLVISNQFGWGYVIGTFGAFSSVITPRVQRSVDGDWSRPIAFPVDFQEGIGYDLDERRGPLEPRSLYSEQLAMRVGRVTDSGNQPPVAVIESLLPNPAYVGEVVYFRGRGVDTDGRITDLSWRSSLDGELDKGGSFITWSLSPGLHRITLTVQDDDGAGSEPTVVYLRVEPRSVPTRIEPNAPLPGPRSMIAPRRVR